jgi:hypothetical protein
LPIPVGSVADPGFAAFLTPESGMGKKSGSGSEMNNPDHVSKETIFWVKILKFFDADPGWKKFGIRDGRDIHPASATLPVSK